MRDFLRRLKYYGLGFTVGLIFVVFFMRNRSCSWSPENRVKTAIFERILVLSEENQKKRSALKLSEKELIGAIQNGDIDFGKSKKDNSFKAYYFTCETKKGTKFSCKVSMPKESYISEIMFTSQNTKKLKSTKTGAGKFIFFPKSKDFIYVDTTDLLLCQQEKLNLMNVNKLFERIKKTGSINFEKSRLNRSPKPEHWISFRGNNNQLISTKSIWYKEKIKIISFGFPGSSSCK